MKNIFKRNPINPILKPLEKLPWADYKVYNPGAVNKDGKFYVFFRAIGQSWVSKIGLAIIDEQENIQIEKHPVLTPRAEYEKNGVEDPRVTKIEDRYLMSYTAYDGECARLAIASSGDLKNWQSHGLAFSEFDARRAGSFVLDGDIAQHTKAARHSWHKAGGIFPSKINGRYWMLFGDRNIWLAHSQDGLDWQPVYEPLLRPRPGKFDSLHIEMGPPPIRTGKGWLVLYHGISRERNYRLGAVLLDSRNPQAVLDRTGFPLFEPSKPYELSGLVDILPGGMEAFSKMEEAGRKKYIRRLIRDHAMPQVVFCPGACLEKYCLTIFYGAGDSVVCQAQADLRELFKEYFGQEKTYV